MRANCVGSRLPRTRDRGVTPCATLAWQIARGAAGTTTNPRPSLRCPATESEFCGGPAKRLDDAFWYCPSTLRAEPRRPCRLRRRVQRDVGRLFRHVQLKQSVVHPSMCATTVLRAPRPPPTGHHATHARKAGRERSRHRPLCLRDAPRPMNCSRGAIRSTRPRLPR